MRGGALASGDIAAAAEAVGDQRSGLGAWSICYLPSEGR